MALTAEDSNSTAMPQFARLPNELQRDEDDARIGVACVTVQERLWIHVIKEDTGRGGSRD